MFPTRVGMLPTGVVGSADESQDNEPETNCPSLQPVVSTIPPAYHRFPVWPLPAAQALEIHARRDGNCAASGRSVLIVSRPNEIPPLASTSGGDVPRQLQGLYLESGCPNRPDLLRMPLADLLPKGPCELVTA